MRIEILINYLEQCLKKWWGSLIFAAVIMTLVYAPFLFSGKVIYGDPTFFNIPYLNFFKKAIESGDSILWNPLNAGGFPAYASLAGFFFPLQFIFLSFLNPVAAFHWLIFLAAIFALFFIIQFLKELGVGIWAALIGGLSFVIGEIFFLPNITVVSYATVFLPLLFLIILKLARRQKPLLYIILGGLSIGLAWLSVMPHFVLWILIAGIAFVIYLAFKEKNKKLILWFVLINFIGLLIGLAQIWPTFWVAQLSQRGINVPYEQLAEDSIRWFDLPRFFFPDFYSYLPIYRSADGIIQGSEASLYIGIIPFLFLALSFFIKVPLGNFFRGLFLAALAIGIEKSPLFYLITKIPILNAFRIPSRYMLIGSFAAAILTGLAGQAFLENKQKSRFLNRRFFLAVSAAIIIIAGFLTVSFTDRFIRIKEGIFSGEFIQGVILVIIGKSMIPTVFLILGLLAIIFFYKQKFRKLPIFTLAAITVADFILVFNFSVKTLPAIFPSEPLPTITFLKSNPARAITLFSEKFVDQIAEAGFKIDSIGEVNLVNLFLTPNYNFLHGLETGNYYEKLLNRDVSRLWSMINVRAGEIFDFPQDLVSKPFALERKLKILKQEQFLFNFLGVRYIISGVDLSSLGMGEAAISPIVENPETKKRVEVIIYENSDAKPLVYFVKKIHGFDTDNEAIFKKFIGFSLVNGEGIFVECGDCQKNAFTAKGSISTIEKKNNFLKLAINVPEEQFLVFSQNYYPGWKAFIDGNEIPIYKVNTVHMGIFVPAGDHEILFKYSYYLPWN